MSHALLLSLSPSLSPSVAATWPLIVFAIGAIVMSVLDTRTQRIPNRTLFALFAGQLGCMLLASMVANDWDALIRALWAAIACFGSALLFAMIHPRGLGGGDVKLAAFVGLALGWLGWIQVVLAGLVALALTAVVAVWQVFGRRQRAAAVNIALAPVVFVASWSSIIAIGVVSAIHAGESL
jgi:leader peptidase (prepilin peptidase)/N-methyltransferase